MKIIHAGSLNVRSGGPALSTWLTIKGLRANGVEAIPVIPPIAEGDRLIDDEANPIYTSDRKFGRLAYVPGIDNTLDNAGIADIYHIQGVWPLSGWQVARFAQAHKRPYVVTLRGMLYPQALAQKSFSKKLSMMAYQGTVLRKAAAIQCTCVEEMEYYRNLGFRNPVAVIPNPIDTDDVIDRPIPSKPQLRIGYLGRVHPRKRIERLIYAFDTHSDALKNAELVIIGADDKEYESFLREEVMRLGLGNIVFTGFLSGEEKDRAITSLSFLAVPSDFENFGNIVTEALVRGVPVYSSTGTPWQSLKEYHCGWWADNSQESINNVILEMARTPDAERICMGENGKRLMREQFAVDILGKKTLGLYSWILDGEPKPDFVYE